MVGEKIPQWLDNYLVKLATLNVFDGKQVRDLPYSYIRVGKPKCAKQSPIKLRAGAGVGIYLNCMKKVM